MKPRGLVVIVGLGFVGMAVASAATRAGFRVIGTVRGHVAPAGAAGVELCEFDDPSPYSVATHVIVTAPPGPHGDPVWHRHRGALRSTTARWIGYISTTGVYGNRGGAWLDESAVPAPGLDRSKRRLAAEEEWAGLGDLFSIALFRTGGIYGPGRSSLDDVRRRTARCVVKPGHAFSRIHRDDIARAVVAAMGRMAVPGRRIFHLVDDEPAEAAEVTREAARLLGVEPPADVPFEVAAATMSEMGRSFWSENRRVSNARTKADLGLEWAYPTFREGLRGILADERAQDASQ